MSSDPYRNDSSLLTVEDVATVLQISKKSAYSLIHSGELPSFRRGRHFCIHKADLQAYQAQLEKSKDAGQFDIELPQAIIDSFARHLVAEIRKYYNSTDGQAAFTEWLEQ